MSIYKVIILAIVQGLAELQGLDPPSPQMTLVYYLHARGL
jgi:hypothetical protein